jgi:cation diffusion facilitator CzcD-associated flavoprotein CzcO
MNSTTDHTTQHRQLIIGAGPVGLAVAKALRDKNIPYDQVEASDDVGGNWYHGVPDTINILSSKKATEYPDFPMPSGYPEFPSGKQMHAYYRMYADRFSLREKIQFNTTVIAVTPVNDSLWHISFQDGKECLYKGVIVCNGHHWKRDYPEYEGYFEGETFHSKDYKSPEQLRGKSVLVIGAGNSGFDIISECAHVSKKSFLSVRKGIWIFPQTFLGKPLSHFQGRVTWLPTWLTMLLAKIMIRLSIGSHKEYGLPKPTIKIDERHPTINTDTLINIKNGRIKVKGDVTKLLGNWIEFTDGSKERIDTIVYATGFRVAIPFLPQSLQRIEKVKVVSCYGYSLYDDYKGLYLVGWFQPRGGVGSLITPYANLLAELMIIQDDLSTPVGNVLKVMGEKLSHTHLFGSIEFLKWIKKMRKNLPRIKMVGQQIDSKNPVFYNKPLVVNKELEEMHQKENRTY